MSGVLIADDFLATIDQPSSFLSRLTVSRYEIRCFCGCIVGIFSQKLGLVKGTILS